MCCLTAESHLQADRRGPTQYRGPCCGPTHSEADQRLSAAPQCILYAFLSLCTCASVSDMHVCLNAGAFLEARVLLLPCRLLLRYCVCVCDCEDVFVLIRDRDPACLLLCPAICHCCTLGSVRMVWAPAVPPVTPPHPLRHRGSLPVQLPDTKVQSQLDCHHTSRIGS